MQTVPQIQLTWCLGYLIPLLSTNQDSTHFNKITQVEGSACNSVVEDRQTKP